MHSKKEKTIKIKPLHRFTVGILLTASNIFYIETNYCIVLTIILRITFTLLIRQTKLPIKKQHTCKKFVLHKLEIIKKNLEQQLTISDKKTKKKSIKMSM